MAAITKTVSVHHSPSAASPAMLVAALNEALLEASLLPPRRLPPSLRSWAPPASTMVAVALLALSCLHYLARLTGGLLGSAFDQGGTWDGAAADNGYFTVEL